MCVRCAEPLPPEEMTVIVSPAEYMRLLDLRDRSERSTFPDSDYLAGMREIFGEPLTYTMLGRKVEIVVSPPTYAASTFRDPGL